MGFIKRVFQALKPKAPDISSDNRYEKPVGAPSADSFPPPAQDQKNRQAYRNSADRRQQQSSLRKILSGTGAPEQPKLNTQGSSLVRMFSLQGQTVQPNRRDAQADWLQSGGQVGGGRDAELPNVAAPSYRNIRADWGSNTSHVGENRDAGLPSETLQPYRGMTADWRSSADHVGEGRGAESQQSQPPGEQTAPQSRLADAASGQPRRRRLRLPRRDDINPTLPSQTGGFEVEHHKNEADMPKPSPEVQRELDSLDPGNTVRVDVDLGVGSGDPLIARTFVHGALLGGALGQIPLKPGSYVGVLKKHVADFSAKYERENGDAASQGSASDGRIHSGSEARDVDVAVPPSPSQAVDSSASTPATSGRGGAVHSHIGKEDRVGQAGQQENAPAVPALSEADLKKLADQGARQLETVYANLGVPYNREDGPVEEVHDDGDFGGEHVDEEVQLSPEQVGNTLAGKPSESKRSALERSDGGSHDGSVSEFGGEHVDEEVQLSPEQASQLREQHGLAGRDAYPKQPSFDVDLTRDRTALNLQNAVEPVEDEVPFEAGLRPVGEDNVSNGAASNPSIQPDPLGMDALITRHPLREARDSPGGTPFVAAPSADPRRHGPAPSEAELRQTVRWTDLKDGDVLSRSSSNVSLGLGGEPIPDETPLTVAQRVAVFERLAVTEIDDGASGAAVDSHATSLQSKEQLPPPSWLPNEKLSPLQREVEYGASVPADGATSLEAMWDRLSSPSQSQSIAHADIPVGDWSGRSTLKAETKDRPASSESKSAFGTSTAGLAQGSREVLSNRDILMRRNARALPTGDTDVKVTPLVPRAAEVHAQPVADSDWLSASLSPSLGLGVSGGGAEKTDKMAQQLAGLARMAAKPPAAPITLAPTPPQGRIHPGELWLATGKVQAHNDQKNTPLVPHAAGVHAQPVADSDWLNASLSPSLGLGVSGGGAEKTDKKMAQQLAGFARRAAKPPAAPVTPAPAPTPPQGRIYTDRNYGKLPVNCKEIMIKNKPELGGIPGGVPQGSVLESIVLENTGHAALPTDLKNARATLQKINVKGSMKIHDFSQLRELSESCEVEASESQRGDIEKITGEPGYNGAKVIYHPDPQSVLASFHGMYG
jgi:hypothetical protein